jgi:uncharacterized protein (TIGR00730 family)
MFPMQRQRYTSVPSWQTLETAMQMLPLIEQRRVITLMHEYTLGIRRLMGLPPLVALFGSARTAADEPMYQAARETAHLLAEAGYGIITGGGPGIMEASNRGAREGGTPSIGCPIQLAREERPNAYLDCAIPFTAFAPRKATLLGATRACVVFPGGLGTLDELFEVAMAVQTRHLPRIPLVLYGSGYWRGLLAWLHETLVVAGTIDAADLDLFQLVETPEEAVTCVLEATPGRRHEDEAQVGTVEAMEGVA